MPLSYSGLSQSAIALAFAGVALALSSCATVGSSGKMAEPLYRHVFVIVEENKDAELILKDDVAPNLARLAKAYGFAQNFYGEVHPSEANYAALLGGDTFSIHDDDAFYCTAENHDPLCPNASHSGYANHTIDVPHLGVQLRSRHLTWKGYYEGLPAPGSLVVNASDPKSTNGVSLPMTYASKHSGFINFKSVQTDPDRARHLVGFDQLEADLGSGELPNFGLIIPNQCNEMHGLYGAGVPADCDISKPLLTVKRGDRVVGELVAKLMATAAWRSRENVAIVVTFDESGQGQRKGCCAVTPSAISNFGGGRIFTVVITNHGPRGIVDPTPYNHYSLLRTLEDVFGITEHLGHAADVDKGVVSMTPLFSPAPLGSR
jgi:hypothetical protein